MVKCHMICCLRALKRFADLLFDGLRALRKGSPNMNSLVGFGSLAAFAISAVGKADNLFLLSFLRLFHFVCGCNLFFLNCLTIVGLAP